MVVALLAQTKIKQSSFMPEGSVRGRTSTSLRPFISDQYATKKILLKDFNTGIMYEKIQINQFFRNTVKTIKSVASNTARTLSVI